MALGLRDPLYTYSFDLCTDTQGDFKKECQVGLHLHVDSSNVKRLRALLHNDQLLLLLMIIVYTVAAVVLKLCIGVHTFPLATPMPLSLVDEPVVDLPQVQVTNPLQVVLLHLLHRFHF